MINDDVAQRTQRHGWKRGLFRMLHNCNTASPLNLPQSGGPVVELTGEYGARNTLLIRLGSGAKRNIDTRTLMLLLRPLTEMNVISLDKKMMVRGSNINLSHFDAFSVLGMHSR